MSREVPRLKHSNSILSLNTLPMWDSSDPERHPPPLPLNPDAQILSSSPTRNSRLYGTARSGSVSPVRQTMKPVTSSSPGDDHNEEILDILNKIQDALKEVNTASKSADATVRKSGKDVDSLLRRSKDNAVDLVSLRDKIYSSEILLSHQLQDIHDILSNTYAISRDSVATPVISSDYFAQIDALKELWDKGILSMGGLLEALPALNDNVSMSARHSSEKLDCLNSHLKSIDRTLLENTGKVNDAKDEIIIVLRDLRRLLTLLDTSEMILSESRKRDLITDGYIKDLRESSDEMRKMLTAMSGSTLYDKDVIVTQMQNISASIASLRDQTQQKDDFAIEDVIRSSKTQVIDKLERFQVDIKSRIDAALSSLASNDTNAAALEDLKLLIATRGDSTLESTIHQHEKLDQILKDIGVLSSNLAPLSLLPEVHASFLDSATQFNESVTAEHSNLMSEVETLRQRKLGLVSEISALESVVKTRSEQLDMLEKRAEIFQQRLTEHIFQKSLRDAPVIEGRKSFQTSARSPLDVLTEAPGSNETNLVNITNAKLLYGEQDMRTDVSHEMSIISDPSSGDVSRSISSGSTNRRVSWSKKIGTMFSSGKENELFIPKRGGVRKVGKGRSVSERW
ncbi:hypothetical protein V1525DRAFT_451777 [Lipomyces kononenkoae]|uniref:Uncharacterized protein n=1 Tax=Lipomyces kononenkoae TaxID=34357 RepID=A0ACC3SWZ2_LIPKO